MIQEILNELSPKRIGENGLRNKAINRITQWSEQNPLHDKRKAPLTKLTAD